MKRSTCLYTIVCYLLLSGGLQLKAQSQSKLKFNPSSVYAGIEVGAKGVKMSVLQLGSDASNSSDFSILKDTSINTDFISFMHPNFEATLNGFWGLYILATRQYKIAPRRIFTVISSGVKLQAEKEKKMEWVTALVDSFRLRTKDPKRQIELVDVTDESRLSHLGIVPENERYTTFLIDIGSGNTKGGYFPYGNTSNFRMFQVNWGTKSMFNATDKKCGQDKSLLTFYKQLDKTAYEAENTGIIYAVNESGAYPKSDKIAFSGGISWAVANLLHPEQFNKTNVLVTYDEVAKFCDKIYSDFRSYSPEALEKKALPAVTDTAAVGKEIRRIHQVFDQKSLMSGSRLLLKIMRQFESVNEKKTFALVKNGQVGWVSAYVDQEIAEEKKQ